MQKLQRSFKVLSEIQRSLSPESHGFSVKTSLNKSLSRSSLQQYQSFSHFSSNSSHSWRPPCNFSHGMSGFLANSLFGKHLISNTKFMIRSKDVFDFKLHFFRAQFPIRHFNNPFNSSRYGWRSWIPSAEGMVWRLITANVAVFVLWRVADPTFMRKNFMISVENFSSGRVHTLITSAFSHIELEHLLSNMIGLYFFGTSIGRIFGPEYLLKLYLAGAVGGSIFYLLHHAFLAPRSKGSGMWYVDPSRIPGLGASGAVNAIILLDIFLFPTATHYINFFIPVPAMLLGAFLIGKDILRMTEGNSQISGSGHLGGAVVAALAWIRIKKRWF